MPQVGGEHCKRDHFLTEMFVACALLERSSLQDAPLNGERGQLRSAVPIFAGEGWKQQLGHPEQPRAETVLDGQDVGGGSFSEQPTPCSSQAARILRDSAGLPVDAVKRVEERSAASVMKSLAQLPGCHLWNHTQELAAAVTLTREQHRLLGKGSPGPPATSLCDQLLSKEQVYFQK
jgi:hypothetical protein